MRSKGSRGRPGPAILLGALLIGGLATPAPAAPAPAARAYDRLPIDDPDTLAAVRGPGTAGSPKPADAAPAAAAPAAHPAASIGLFGSASRLLQAAASGVRAVTAAAGEGLYEAAYMFGANPTPIPRAGVVDPLPESRSTTDDVVAPPQKAVSSIDGVPAGATTAAPPSAAIGATASSSPPPAAAGTFRPASIGSPPAASVPDATAVDPGAVEPGLLSNFIYDRAARRADGSYFVPKSLQRLFGVRTQRVATATVPSTVRLAGRIVPDPNAHGRVEASLMGRIEPPPEGLAVLGASVRGGQILAYVQPAVGVVDRTQVRRQVAELTTAIRVETENLEILKQFFFVPFRDGKIYQAEQRIAGLRRERDAILPMLQTRELLRAPTDGVISMSTAIPGRIVHPGEMIFDIVNPRMLWIEASAPDATTADEASHVRTATALTTEGQTLTVSFVGSGLATQQQSTPILFRIDDPPAGLRIGRPVTITLQSDQGSERGIVLSRDAVTVGSDGVQQVWEQTAPETFLPHPVRLNDLDGRTVLILDGVADGAHIVVQGARRLLAQLQ